VRVEKQTRVCASRLSRQHANGRCLRSVAVDENSPVLCVCTSGLALGKPRLQLLDLMACPT